MTQDEALQFIGEEYEKRGFKRRLHSFLDNEYFNIYQRKDGFLAYAMVSGMDIKIACSYENASFHHVIKEEEYLSYNDEVIIKRKVEEAISTVERYK